MSHTLPFAFLRYSLGLSQEFEGASRVLTHEEWVELFKFAKEQCLAGVFYCGMQKLPDGFKPPQNLALRWTIDAESIRGQNEKVDAVASALTERFNLVGCKPVVLKGPANARYYPEAQFRYPGDIDFFIAGGKEFVISKIHDACLADNFPLSSHHASFTWDDIEVEVHFVATDAYSPRKNDALQSFLSDETQKSYATAGGFNVPSMVYALMMQVSHIKQHLFKGGIGLRQLIDYHQLLQHSTKEERSQVANKLRDCGQDKIAGALMYVLREILALDEGRMLCAPDERRGKFLLKIVLEGGNFGWYAEDYIQPVINRWFKDRVRFFRLLPFDATEALWRELFYWRDTVKLIPRRIKQRRLALGKR